MKKLLILAIAMLLVSISNVYATPVFSTFDLNSLGIAVTGDGVTSLFDKMTIDADATSVYANAGIFVGNTFTDTGNLKVMALTNPNLATVDAEGLNLAAGWEMTGNWNNLNGAITGFDGGSLYYFGYSSGSMNLYVDQPPDGTFGVVGAGDDVGMTNGNPVASLSLVTGWGTLDTATLAGTTNLVWRFDSVAPNFWYYQDPITLAIREIPVGYTFSLVDSRPEQGSLIISGNTIQSRNHAFVRTDVVPEPTSMVLLGIGVAGLAMFRRKRAA